MVFIMAQNPLIVHKITLSLRWVNRDMAGLIQITFTAARLQFGHATDWNQLPVKPVSPLAG